MKHLNKEKEKKTKVNFVSSGERKFKYLKIYICITKIYITILIDTD
jgi:hypothetical protein